jgi:hypothetical protein
MPYFEPSPMPALLHAAERRDLGRDDALVDADDAYYFPSLKAGSARSRTAKPIAKLASRRKWSSASSIVDSARLGRLAGSFMLRKWERGFLRSIGVAGPSRRGRRARCAPDSIGAFR